MDESKRQAVQFLEKEINDVHSAGVIFVEGRN